MKILRNQPSSRRIRIRGRREKLIAKIIADKMIMVW